MSNMQGILITESKNSSLGIELLKVAKCVGFALNLRDAIECGAHPSCKNRSSTTETSEANKMCAVINRRPEVTKVPTATLFQGLLNEKESLAVNRVFSSEFHSHAI